jgi:hypothetical protein
VVLVLTWCSPGFQSVSVCRVGGLRLFRRSSISAIETRGGVVKVA